MDLASPDALLTSFEIFSTIAGGIPAGPQIPNQSEYSKPGRPDSAIVGTLGNKEDRFEVLTAIALTLPPLISSKTEDIGAKYASTLPPTISVSASLDPL